MSICWLYPLVVLLLGLHNVEAELLVKLYRTLVVDLHVCEDKSTRHGQIQSHLSLSVCLHHIVRHISSPIMNTNNQTDDLHLYMKKDGSIVAVLLDNVENMFKHPRADTKSSVRRQAPQGHYVELQLTV